MLKSAKSPYGYKKLLVYQKAEELQLGCSALTHSFPRHKTLSSLADQMDRSARSVKQNIVEGWKRNSTKEYYEFLGFSIGANAELEEDCMDIWKGVYPELKGIKGVMGERGITGEKGTPSSSVSATHSSATTSLFSSSLRSTPPSFPPPSTPLSHTSNSLTPSPSTLSSPSSHFTPSSRHSQFTHSSPSSHSTLLDIEKLPFYPLDRNLPPVVQLKLRAKEINFLLAKLQKSLEDKMTAEHTLSTADRFKKSQTQKHSDDKWYEKALNDQGFIRLENGKIVKKE